LLPRGLSLQRLSSIGVRRPKTVVLLFVLTTLLAAAGALRLKEEENLLVFLPTTDPDVQLFKDVSRTFGSLRVALVGVEAPAGQDLFTRDTIRRITAASAQLHNVSGVDDVVSLTRMQDIVASPSGADWRSLVEAVPNGPDEERALRERVMSRDLVVGSLVSKDGRAALIMVFLADGARDRAVTDAIREVAERELRPLGVYYGGAPFASIDIYQEAQNDVWRLSPLAMGVLLLVIVLSFRDPVGVLLTVLSVAISTLWVLGGMGWIGDKFTVATSTLPVILFASGSSYAVHVLGRYYLLQKEKPAKEAISEALVIVGPPLAIAAATTSVGFFAFVVTDVTPMRNFGIACGAGVVLCWVTSLTLVPAVVALWPRHAAPHAKLARIGDWLVDLWHWSRRYRAGVIGACILAAAICAGPMTRVEVRMEPRAFFRPGSEPWKADRFLNEHFGGNTFVLIAAHGDLDDPWTMREIERLSDYARSLPGVSQVLSVMDYLKLANWGMGSGRRLPTSQVQAGNLYVFLQNETAIKALLSQDRRNALIEVRVRGDGAEVVRALEEFARKDLRARPKMPTRDDAADRVAWLATGFGHKPDVARLRNAMKLVAEPGNLDVEWRRRRGEVLLEFAKSDDALVLTDEGRASIIRQAEESQKRVDLDLDGFLKTLGADSSIAADNLRERLDEERRQMGLSRALPLAMEAAGFDKPTSEETRAVSQSLDVLFSRAGGVAPAKAELGAKIAGEPVLNRGFSRSVGRNLDHSLLVSIVAVLLFMLLLFRSPRLAVVCMIPSGLTMAVIFGTMGAWGVHIDLGTSLVAGIATGAGSDFAMHYLWYLRRQSADEVSRSVGPVMVVSIVLVALGFVVLALGKSPVMHLFGTLAGLSMALSAFLTCLLVPSLLNRFGAPPRSPIQ
jgi:uncharacterized protein